MYPLSLAGKYLPTLSSTSHWYPLECYQVACERLYGRANCLAVLTENLERRDVEKSRQQLQMVVTQVTVLFVFFPNRWLKGTGHYYYWLLK